jgi:hypothetical protein
VLPLHPWRGHRARRARSGAVPAAPTVAAEAAADALADHAAVDALLARVERPAGRLTVAKDAGYLGWRYGGIDGYHAVRDTAGGELRGLAVFRTDLAGRAGRTTVCELLVPTGDGGVARRLLREVTRAARVDYVVCSFPRGTTERRAALRSGFLPLARGELLLVYPLVPDPEPDPTDHRSWALSLGDVELL